MRFYFNSSWKRSWKFSASRDRQKNDYMKLKTRAFLIKKSKARCLNMNYPANAHYDSVHALYASLKRTFYRLSGTCIDNLCNLIAQELGISLRIPAVAAVQGRGCWVPRAQHSLLDFMQHLIGCSEIYCNEH